MMARRGAAVQRIEAVYTKVLVARADLLQPQQHNLTPETRVFFERLFQSPRELCCVG